MIPPLNTANLRRSLKNLSSPVGRTPAENDLEYVTKEKLGFVDFTFKGNERIRVTMQETLC